MLGGTHHVGRAVVEAGLERGDEVVTLNRGFTGVARPGVDARHADRLDLAALATALGDDTFDAVVDTWSSAPVAVRDAARLLSGSAGHYTYVSSRSVYTWPLPIGLDELGPVVTGDPASEEPGDYAADKRGGELAVLAEFDGPVLIARAGLVLGPYENVGRLPFWLNRTATGGRIPAPGPPDRPLQLIDARDLANWVLDHQPAGVFNTVSPPGHTTIGELLEECVRVTDADAELVWLPPKVVERANVAPWTELPIWVPPTGELAGLHACDASAAQAAGLRCRAIGATVSDTWSWLQREGSPQPITGRAGTGMDAAGEERLWAAAKDSGREGD